MTSYPSEAALRKLIKPIFNLIIPDKAVIVFIDREAPASQKVGKKIRAESDGKFMEGSRWHNSQDCAPLGHTK